MRSLAALITLATVMVGCTAGPVVPPASPEAPATPSAVADATAEPARCRDAAPPIDATSDRAVEAPERIPGRALFWDGGKLRLLEGGQVRDLDTAFPVRDWSSRLGPDGRTVALLGGESPGEAHLWERTRAGSERLVKMPIALGTDDTVSWSPGLQRVHWGRWEGDDIWVVGLDGGSYRAAFEGDAIFGAIWRSDEELTVITRPRSGGSWPIVGATLWSWRPPADPVRLVGPMTLTTVPRWSADGRTLASIEQVAGSGRAVVLRGAGERTLLTERDLHTGPTGCLRDVQFTGLSWSPTGGTLAILGRGIGYFVAFVDIAATAKPAIFASPVGAGSCYIPGRVEWHARSAVVPLFGPDCGSRDAGRENALALVDPNTGVVTRYVSISRKGLLAMSGPWAATSSGQDGEVTEFVSIDGDGARFTVPLRRVVSYCCAP